MTTQTDKAKAKLATLSSSFDDLEVLLDPLFAQTLPETIVGLEPLQQAKLQTVLPYLVYDLVFIYLKSRGIDPKTHPVVSELDRVKQYFQKLSAAENPPTKRIEVDKAAAQRFIKHAIAQVAPPQTPTATDGPSTTAQPTVRIQAKITSKMLERQLYEQQLKEQDAQESEEEQLRVFDDSHNQETNPNPDSSLLEARLKDTGKGKAVEGAAEHVSNPSKRKRPLVDPFAGYGDETSRATPDNTVPLPDSQKEPSSSASQHRTKKKKAVESTLVDPSAAADSSPSAKTSKKNKKKSKKPS